MPDWRSQGNTAVITGGASCLCLEAARRCAQSGMNLVIADVNDEALAETYQAWIFEATGGEA